MSTISRILPIVTATLACGEFGNLAVSAGASVAAAVGGVITICGRPVPSPELQLRVEQNHAEQARPVAVRIGPFTGNPHGSYLVEVGPAFAVPGSAHAALLMTSPAGLDTVARGTLEFAMGTPARDTLRLDADLGLQSGSCGPR